MKINTKMATALCAVALTGVGAIVTTETSTQTVFANHQGTKVWLQYGTLKYDLRAPSGRVYPAGTRVVRELSYDDKPNLSYPAKSFYLTLEIGGIPGNQLLQDVGGGKIAEAYVNYEDWQEIDYPSNNVVLVNNTSDYTDLSSSDFHPVDSSNPDVPVADTSKLDAAFLEYTSLDTSHYSKEDIAYGTDLQNRYFAAKAMGITQAVVDSLTKEVNQAITKCKETGHIANGSNSTDTPSNNTGNSGGGSTTGSSTSTSTNTTSPRTVRLRKASYRYTSKGKRVSKKLLKKGSYVKINGKTYYIKGKTYYRIGKNRYIRKANVTK